MPGNAPAPPTAPSGLGVPPLRAWLRAGLLACLLSAPAAAAPAPHVAVIIDDLGNHALAAARVAALPGPVTCSVLPHTPHAAATAERCHRAGKEVMLHLPMQPDRPGHRPGPGSLLRRHARPQIADRIRAGLADVPYVTGVNNHMGSHLTRHVAYMQWVMESLREGGAQFFVDSYTSPKSVALRVATANGLPAVGRDVFLDHVPEREHIRRQIERLMSVARRNGRALAIGHPHAVTLDELERALPALAADGIMLVTVSDLIRLQGEAPWPSSSYRSLTASKRSRPSPSSTCCGAAGSTSSSPVSSPGPSAAPTASP